MKTSAMKIYSLLLALFYKNDHAFETIRKNIIQTKLDDENILETIWNVERKYKSEIIY